MSKEFTNENFEAEVITASEKKPVLVDFFASWCGPCKMQGPIVDEVAEVMGDKAVIGKLNTEAAQETAAKFGIMSIPTIMLFKDGKAVETFTGLQSKDALLEAIKKHI